MRIKKGFELRKIGDEDIIVAVGVENVSFNKVIRMNESAAWLWNEIGEREFSVDILACCLVSKYQIEKYVAITDARFIVQEWLKVGIVEE